MKNALNQNTITDDWDNAENAFINHNLTKALSPHTIVYYKSRLKAFRKYLTDANIAESPATLTPASIEGFFLSEAKKHSPTTVHHDGSMLSAFYQWMIKFGYIDELNNPMRRITIPKRRNPNIKPYSKTQLESLLNTCATNSFVDTRDRAMLLLIYDAALRITELCTIKISDISWIEKRITVMGKGSKERTVFLMRLLQKPWKSIYPNGTVLN